MSAFPASTQNASVAVATPFNTPTTTSGPAQQGTPLTPHGSPGAASTVQSPGDGFDDQAIHDDRFSNRRDYLGNPAILNACTWGEDEEVSNGDILKWTDTGEAALLCGVGQVVPDRMKLSPLGNHEEKYGKPISDAKWQFTVGGCLSSGVLQQAWGTTTTVLQQFQRMGASTPQHRHLLTEHRGRTGVRISCPVFVGRTEVYDPTGKDRGDPLLSYSVPPAQRAALATIVENYRLNDVRVYDIDGSLIHPTVFATRLPGAVVEVWFTLHHFLFGNNGGGDRASDTFTARLFQLRVLRRNSRGVGSPLGRNPSLGPYVPPSPSRLTGAQPTNLGAVSRVLNFGTAPPVPGGTGGASALLNAPEPAPVGPGAGGSSSEGAGATPPTSVPVPTSAGTPALPAGNVATSTVSAPATAQASPSEAPSGPSASGGVTGAEPNPLPVDAPQGLESGTETTSHVGVASSSSEVRSQPPPSSNTASTPDTPSPPEGATTRPAGLEPTGTGGTAVTVGCAPATGVIPDAGTASLAPPHPVGEGTSDASGKRKPSEAGPSTRSTKKIRLTLNGKDV